MAVNSLAALFTVGRCAGIDSVHCCGIDDLDFFVDSNGEVVEVRWEEARIYRV